MGNLANQWNGAGFNSEQTAHQRNHDSAIEPLTVNELFCADVDYSDQIWNIVSKLNALQSTTDFVDLSISKKIAVLKEMTIKYSDIVEALYTGHLNFSDEWAGLLEIIDKIEINTGRLEIEL